jgi:hypothetical protein
MDKNKVIWTKEDIDNNGDYRYSFERNGKSYDCYRSPTGEDFSCVVTEDGDDEGEVIDWKPSLAEAKRFLEAQADADSDA